MLTFQFSRNGFVLFVLFFIILNATSAQPKGYLYDEQKVRHYTLPNPLVCEDGSAVTDSVVWFEKRRLEILHLFENEVYGRSPKKPKHIKTIAKFLSLFGKLYVILFSINYLTSLLLKSITC